MPAATECCGISRRVRVSTATSIPQRLAGGAARGWSVGETRAAGRPMCATCPALRTDRTARRSETDSTPSATAPALATCSADSLFRAAPVSDAETQAHRRAPTRPRHRRIGSSLVARRERSRSGAHAETRPVQRLRKGERRDSNPRPPGPQPGAPRPSGVRFRSVEPNPFGQMCPVSLRLSPRLRPRARQLAFRKSDAPRRCTRNRWPQPSTRGRLRPLSAIGRTHAPRARPLGRSAGSRHRSGWS
jgi:hypothetical protein